MTNLELGTLFSTYGTVAFLSYIFGGVLADKYSPKKFFSPVEGFLVKATPVEQSSPIFPKTIA